MKGIVGAFPSSERAMLRSAHRDQPDQDIGLRFVLFDRPRILSTKISTSGSKHDERCTEKTVHRPAQIQVSARCFSTAQSQTSDAAM